MTFLAPVVYGVFKYDSSSKQSLKEKFSLENVHASTLYFPETVDYHGKIHILDINAIDPQLIETDNDTKKETNTDSNDNDKEKEKEKVNDEQPKEEESTTKKYVRSFSRKSMKWFSKIKQDAQEVQ
eukprot:33964_1